MKIVTFGMGEEPSGFVIEAEIVFQPDAGSAVVVMATEVSAIVVFDVTVE